MSSGTDERLLETIRLVGSKIDRFKDKGLGEQNTKASMIEPILESLGWDIRDPDEVHREFKPTSKDSPVDYALKILRRPRLLVEAKGLGEDLADRKWISQVLGYATVAGVEWCVLTDGDHFRFYNATVALEADKKLFCEFRLSESSETDAAKTLQLISRRNMEENLISVLWSAHFVDRQVKEALETMIETVDRRLVRLIRARSAQLKSSEIAESLRRLEIQIEQPIELPEIAGAPARDAMAEPDRRSAAARRAWETRRARARDGSNTVGRAKEASKPKRTKIRLGVKLADLIRAGLLNPPTRLFRNYKGTLVEATLRPNGSVEFGGELYPSASTAAEAARALVTGERKHTNGWTFWQYDDSSGGKWTLDDVRQKFLASRRSMSANELA